MIQDISAVTFAVRDMARSVEFYRKLGFELVYGGEQAAFSSLKAGAACPQLWQPLGDTSPGGGAVLFSEWITWMRHHRKLQAQGRSQRPGAMKVSAASLPTSPCDRPRFRRNSPISRGRKRIFGGIGACGTLSSDI